MIAKWTLRMDIDDVDDTAAALAQARRCGLGEKQGCLEIAADEIVPLSFGNVAERRGIKGGRIVDEDVDAAAPAGDRGDQFGYRCRLEKIAPKRGRRVRPQRIQLRDEVHGIVRGMPVMDADVGARGMQLCGNLRPYPARGAGHQCDAALEARCAAH